MKAYQWGNPDQTIVLRQADQVCIPADQGNADWRQFQAWCDAGNAPDPALEPEAEPPI